MIKEATATKHDELNLQINGRNVPIDLPQYGEVKLTVQNGKITASQVTISTKHY